MTLQCFLDAGTRSSAPERPSVAADTPQQQLQSHCGRARSRLFGCAAAQIDVYGLVILQLVHGVLLLDAARANAMIQSLYVFAFEAVIVAVALTIRFARRWCARGAH